MLDVFRRLLPVALGLAAAVSVRASLATAWHIPDDNTDLGFNLRNPEFAIGTSSTVMLYTGVLNWSSVSGKVYQVWSTTNLGQPFSIFGGTITATDLTASYTNSPAGGVRFYRVQLFP